MQNKTNLEANFVFTKFYQQEFLIDQLVLKAKLFQMKSALKKDKHSNKK